ncbi:hypothetical protein BASA81_005880 [Batrachochytrium salamandrivorans]|nr:hypothetical protein BASA81_005880 [Batrachochytrium salamandrivorans]
MSPSPLDKRFWVSTGIVSLLGFSVRRPNIVLFMLGWPGSELAQIWLVLQSINLVSLFNSKHSTQLFESKWVKLGLLLNLLAIKSGTDVLRENIQSRDAFNLALSQANIPPRAGESFAKTLPGALLSLLPLLAVSRRGKEITIERDIPYADINEFAPELVQRWKNTPTVVRPMVEIARGRLSKWMTMNVFHLKGNTNLPNAPVLASFHGGAWALADKWISAHSLFQRIASRGVIVCIINYRMSPEAPWPTHIQDCKRGLIYIKKHCHEWGGDANNVFISGESAGGHLCALAALTNNLPEFQPPELPNEDTSVRGALPLYGILDFTNASGASENTLLFSSKVLFQTGVSLDALQGEFSRASPLYHLRQLLKNPDPSVGKDIVPFFSMHGTLDVLAPYDDFKLFVSEFKQLRIKTGEENKGDVFVTLPGAHHAVGFLPSPRNDALADAMCDFIYHHQVRKPRL